MAPPALAFNVPNGCTTAAGARGEGCGESDGEFFLISLLLPRGPTVTERYECVCV